MIKKKIIIYIITIFVVACSGCKENAEKPNDVPTLATEVINEGRVMTGGMLNVAMVKDEPFQGIFLAELSEDGYDATLMGYASNALFEYDGDFLITNKGIAALDVDTVNRKVTVRIRQGVKWSDGTPLTIEDVIRPYLIMGHKDYTGVRYDTDLRNIIGIEQYHTGTVNTISGLQKVNETTLDIYFKQLSPAIFSGGDGLWGYAAPDHILKNIPVADLVASDVVRKRPVTLGAFVFDKIIPGESVQFKKNKHYWKGEPKLDGVIVKVVPSSSISAAIQADDYDIVSNFNATKWGEIKNLDHITVLSRPELYYSYIGFKLGHFDTAKGEVVVNPNAKMADKALRQAMGYALDIEQVSEVYDHYLRERANSFIPPVFQSLYDASFKGFVYNPKKAKQLLDQAGYKDIDDDGFRETPTGQKLEITLAAMASDAIQQDVVAYYQQNWKDIGLNVTLLTGRLMEFNLFYDKIQADDPEMDVFIGAWSTGINPSPASLYSKTAPLNFSRYTDAKLETLLKNIDSDKAFDVTYRVDTFRQWQQYMKDVATVIPMQFRYEIVPVSKRVKQYSIDYVNGTELHEIELVAN